MLKTKEEKICLEMPEDLIMNLLKGQKIIYQVDGLQIQITNKRMARVIPEDLYRDLKRFHNDPEIVRAIIEKIEAGS